MWGLFSDALSLGENIKQNLFREAGLFRSDPNALIGEQVRDPTNYQAVLTAIAEGSRHPADIALAAGLSHRSSAGSYLARLAEMNYVRCELPVTIPTKQRHSSRLGRYVLADNYLRFYFRFVQPNSDLLAHWGGGTQVDVAAINWRDKALLLGEAKWGEAISFPPTG